MSAESMKQAAAVAAVARVRPDMVVGLGTGSTASCFVDALAERMKRERFRITGVPTSERTAAQARALGIPLATLEDHPRLDLAVDGADEIQLGSLSLIKGAGGALLREKLVAIAAARLIIIADASKVMQQLGTRFAVPVEIVRFGWRSTAERLRSLGCEPVQRQDGQGRAVVTDEGHYLLDCRFPPISDAATLGQALKAVVGVIEHGLFIGMASEAIVAGPESIQVLRPE